MHRMQSNMHGYTRRGHLPIKHNPRPSPVVPVGGAGGSFPANDAASTSYARAGPVGAPHQMQLCLAVAEHGSMHTQVM